MFLLTPVLIALAAAAAYWVLHRQAQPATGVVDTPAAVAVPRRPFWPTTVEGKIGVGAFILSFVRVALVNVIQVAYLGWVVVLAALAFSTVARLAKHDRSTSVLVVLILTAISALFSALFLAGEVFIGHD